jgi:Ca-activated chloride channel family protein
VQLLGTLRPSDRFRVITFSSDVRRYASGWTDASGEHVRDAQQWVRNLSAGGGTNIAGALAEAFATAPAEGGLGVVVFLTDGMPTVGETDPERIANAAERDRSAFRVFAFGIGYDVNTYVLDRLTERARGTTEYIQPDGDIERAVGSLAGKVSSPVLTDLALRADGADLYDAQPGSLPDLFAGDELVVFGRVRGLGRGEWGVTVSGRRNGHEERFGTNGPAAQGSGAEYIPQLWAARKAGALAREIRLHGQNPEIVTELKRLALRYGILTEYTSYLVQEPNQVVVRPLFDRLAPAAQVGALAVDRARREAKSAAVANAAEAADMDGAVRGGVGGETSRRVGGRLLVWRDSVWTDVAHGDSLRVVRVAAFSDAYFALLRALPELVKAAALEPAVLVAGRRVSIKIDSEGTSTWHEGELERLVREFRG